MPALNALYKRYRNDVAFFVVYIGEAHPSDAWQVPSNMRDKVVYASPRNEGERTNLADVCVTRLGIKLPAPRIAWKGRVDAAGVVSLLTVLQH